MKTCHYCQEQLSDSDCTRFWHLLKDAEVPVPRNRHVDACAECVATLTATVAACEHDWEHRSWWPGNTYRACKKCGRWHRPYLTREELAEVDPEAYEDVMSMDRAFAEARQKHKAECPPTKSGETCSKCGYMSTMNV